MMYCTYIIQVLDCNALIHSSATLGKGHDLDEPDLLREVREDTRRDNEAERNVRPRLGESSGFFALKSHHIEPSADAPGWCGGCDPSLPVLGCLPRVGACHPATPCQCWPAPPATPPAMFDANTRPDPLLAQRPPEEATTGTIWQMAGQLRYSWAHRSQVSIFGKTILAMWIGSTRSTITKLLTSEFRLQISLCISSNA